jgi:hypothetical protein
MDGMDLALQVSGLPAQHGMKRTPVYRAWTNMLERCTNPKNPQWDRYGGRGITVCERWRDFRNFYADMGDRPDGLTLDRWPDNDRGYEPGNVRWATRKQQQRNTRSSLSTHCPAGHEFTEANTYLDKDGWRNCRACHAEQERARREANRDKQPRFCQNCGTLLGAARILGTRYCTKSCAARARRAAHKRQLGLAA